MRKLDAAPVFEEQLGKGRPKGGKEQDYEVHAYATVDGRIKLKQVCALPAQSEKLALKKAQNFCDAFGYDFSHTVKL